MEKDLKVLENIINELEGETHYLLYTNKEKVQAIENLIYKNKELEHDFYVVEKENKRLKARNKELEEENKELHKEINQRVKVKLENERIVDKDYIPKSKVREFQDKYKSKIDKLENKKIWNEPVDTINKNRYTNYFNAYEELLEGDK